MGVLCQIFVDKPSDSVHRAGEVVSGVVKYAVTSATKFNNITLSFRGESWCSWASLTCDDCTTHLGTDEHVSQVVSLLDVPGETRIFPAGHYQQHFAFTLPKSIPPSFTQLTGQVTYKITLEFKREGLYNATRIFEALVPVQNYVKPTLPHSTTLDVEKSLFKLFPVGKQKISLRAEIEQPLVTPGENAVVKCLVKNDSFVTIRSIKAALCSTTVYTSNSGATTTYTERIANCMVEVTKVPSCSVTEMSISVPTLAEHRTVQHSRTISNDYYILITLSLPIPLSNIKTILPILIGEREKKDKEAKIDEFPENVPVIDCDPPPSYMEVIRTGQR